MIRTNAITLFPLARLEAYLLTLGLGINLPAFALSAPRTGYILLQSCMLALWKGRYEIEQVLAGYEPLAMAPKMLEASMV